MKTKDFDCVKMMRDIRDEIDKDINNMNSEQILEYIKKGSIKEKNKSIIPEKTSDR